jgi:EpsI family protein
MSTSRLAVACVLVTMTAVIAASSQRPVSAAVAPPEVPYSMAAWEGEDAPPLDAETERVVNADEIINRTYVDPDGIASGLYIAFYAQQRPGTSIHSPLHCLPGTGWEVLSNDVLDVNVDGRPGSIRRLIAQKDAERVMVLDWYDIHGRMIANDFRSRLQLLTDRVRLGRNDAALVRVAVPVNGSDRDAERRGMAFIRALVGYL